MKRKLSGILLVCLLAVSILMTACDGIGGLTAQTGPDTSGTSDGASGAGDQTPSKKPITFTMFSGDQSQAPPKDNPIRKKLEELTGVTIEFEFLVGDLSQKMGVMIASGDYPDLMNPSQSRSTAMEAGVFMPLEDLIPKYPNIKKHYEPFLDKMYAACGGEHIYLMDNFGRYYGEWFPSYLNGTGFWIQKDVLADAGYPIPKTLDEYFTLIENYKKKYPEIDGQPTIGFEVLSYDWRSFCLKNPPQHLVGHPNDGDVVVDQETFIADLYQNKDYAKRYYKKLNEEFNKDIIEVDTFTQNYDGYLAKISTGRVLGMFDQYWNFETGERPLTNLGKWERTYIPVPITYEGYRDWYLEAVAFTGGNGMGLTVKCKDPERAMEYINFLLEEDIQKLLTWGIEGIHYHVDENGMYYRTEQERQNQRDTNYLVNNLGHELSNQFPKIQGIFSDGNWWTPAEQPGEVQATQSEYDREFLSHYGFQLPTEFLSKPPAPTPPDYYPVWAYTIEEGSPAKMAFDSLTDLENRTLPRIITAKPEEFESAWAAYMAEMEKIDTKAYLDEVQRQIDERMGIKR
jgi:putative aldouronate transport system substrate-binding protein